MQYLTQLTPAEISFVSQHNDVSLKDVAKMTFFHLVIRGALQIRTETRVDRRKGRDRIFEYVAPGPNYTNYPAKPHELLFLELFNDERRKGGLLLRYFIRLVYEKAIATDRLARKVAQSRDMIPYLAYPRLARWLGLFFKLSRHGELRKAEMINELESVKESFVNALKEERSRAMEIAIAIGGNLLFIHPFDSELGTLFDQEMIAAMNQRTFTDDVVEAAWWHDWGNGGFDSFSDSFDSGYSSAESSWDSGGSGCGGSGCSSSGCSSGCSGCGSGGD